MASIHTECLGETRYLLLRAMRTRGIFPTPEIAKGNDTISVVFGSGRFSLTHMPGNRRILISHDVFVEPEARGKGVGKALLRLREEFAEEAGINLLLATVRNDNVVEIHILESNGWRRFNNRLDTGVSLWGKEL